MSTAKSVSAPTKAGGRPPRSLRLKIHGWLRWLHIYISMFSLLAILFFSITGITLNHPDWAISSTETTRELKGTLPSDWKEGDKVNWFKVAEYLRATHGIRGIASDERADESEGNITFKGPGYSADCVIEIPDGTYNLTVTAQGFVGVMNDFHRGRDTGTGWKWLIDISGVLLTLVSVTGLGLLWYLKKIRMAAFLTAGGGAILVWVLMKLAM